MSVDPSRDALAVFLVFCRIGACVNLLPGFSSARVPTFVRLWLSGALALVFTPLVVGARAQDMDLAPFALVRAIVGEIFIGVALGLVIRVLFAALETMATAVALALGLSSIFTSVEAEESQPSITILLTLCATELVFASDLHLDLLRGLVDSYRILPIGVHLPMNMALDRLVESLGFGFALCLRLLAGPLAFALFANLAAGLLNRLAPQIQAYFLAAPFVLGGGLYLLYDLASRSLALFGEAVAMRVGHW